MNKKEFQRRILGAKSKIYSSNFPNEKIQNKSNLTETSEFEVSKQVEDDDTALAMRLALLNRQRDIAKAEKYLVDVSHRAEYEGQAMDIARGLDLLDTLMRTTYGENC